MNIRYENTWPVSERTYPLLHALYVSQFRDNLQRIVGLLNGRSNPSCFLAWEGDTLVGFKMGSGLGNTYNSTMGAVGPASRRRGVARTLLRLQHAFAREHGYTTVETTTKNCFRSMLLLNIAEGFDVVGVTVQRHEPLITLHKRIDGEAGYGPETYQRDSTSSKASLPAAQKMREEL